MKRRNYLLFLSMIAMFVTRVAAEDGSRLWLRQTAGDSIVHISIPRQSPTLNIAAEELRKDWKGVPVELHIDKKQEKTCNKTMLFQQILIIYDKNYSFK